MSRGYLPAHCFAVLDQELSLKIISQLNYHHQQHNLTELCLNRLNSASSDRTAANRRIAREQLHDAIRFAGARCKSMAREKLADLDYSESTESPRALFDSRLSAVLSMERSELRTVGPKIENRVP